MLSRSALLQDLRQSMRAINSHHAARNTSLCAGFSHSSDKSDADETSRLSFGHQEIDMLLDGGIAPGEMHEVRHDLASHAGAATGFLCALLARHAFLKKRNGKASSHRQQDLPKIVWITEPRIRLDSGGLYPDGLCQLGLCPQDFLLVQPANLRDCLWAAGEAAGTPGFLAIVLQLSGHPRAFDLSASRQLLLRAQSGGTALFVLRHSSSQEASSALTRWCVTPEPSFDEDFEPGIGAMRLGLSLEKNRNGPTGTWTIAWNPTTRSFDDASFRVSATPCRTHSRHSFSLSANRTDNAPPQQGGQAIASTHGFATPG